MALSVRDCWLVAALPGILTSAAYIYGPARTAETKAKIVNIEMEKERAKPVDFKQFKTLGEEYETNQDAVASAREEANSVSGAATLQLGSATEDRSVALHTVSSALQAHGLLQIKSQRVEGGADSVLPERIQNVWKPYAAKVHAVPPQCWRVEIQGSYPHVVSACEELAHSLVFIVPLSITMEAPQSRDASEKDKLQPVRPGDLKWVLTLWL